MDKSQRQYFLREQLKAIQKELGEEDGKGVETEDLRKKLYDAKMPPEVEKEALNELNSLAAHAGVAPEYSSLQHLLRLVGGAALERSDQRRDRSAEGARDSRCRSLRSRKSEKTHYRISRRAQTQARGKKSDPVLSRPAGSRQDLPRPKHRPSDGSQVRAPKSRRRP